MMICVGIKYNIPWHSGESLVAHRRKYDIIPWHRMSAPVSCNIGRNGRRAGFVFCFNCIFPRFLITVLWPLILMSSQQGAQTWITAEGKNSQTSFAKKYKIWMFLSIVGCFKQCQKDLQKIINLFAVVSCETSHTKLINQFNTLIHPKKGLMVRTNKDDREQTSFIENNQFV